jgi:hypothetical protein
MNSEPLFSIGIPTWQRADYLRQSLASARAQTYPQLEIIVCDNASQDHTEQVVREAADPRIRYHRNATNIGPDRNFSLCLELATGRYFSWLQDDDWLCGDFVAQAVRILEENSAAGCCAAQYYGTGAQSLSGATVFAPHLPLDWVSGRSSEVPLDLLIPVSLFETIGMPPASAFDRLSLKRAWTSADHTDFPLYAERSLLIAAAVEGPVHVIPKCLSLFRCHPEQRSRELLSTAAGERREYAQFVSHLCQLWDRQDRSLAAFAAILPSLETGVIRWWQEKAAQLPTDQKLTRGVSELLRGEMALPARAVPTSRYGIRDLARDALPPILARAAAKVVRRIKA